MGWRAITKTGEELREDAHGRPVQAGEEGKLLVIAQEDYGHKIAVDLLNGRLFIDYETLNVQNGSLDISGEKIQIWILDETNIVGEMFDLKQEFVDFRDEDGRKVIVDGKFVKVRNDILIPLIWRPIWFSRVTTTAPGPTKVIGAQVTLPAMQGGKNIKKMVSLYPDGRIGID